MVYHSKALHDQYKNPWTDEPVQSKEKPRKDYRNWLNIIQRVNPDKNYRSFMDLFVAKDVSIWLSLPAITLNLTYIDPTMEIFWNMFGGI